MGDDGSTTGSGGQRVRPVGGVGAAVTAGTVVGVCGRGLDGVADGAVRWCGWAAAVDVGTGAGLGSGGDQQDGTDEHDDHRQHDEDVEPEQGAAGDVEGPGEGPPPTGTTPIDADVPLGQDQSGIVEVGQGPQVLDRRRRASPSPDVRGVRRGETVVGRLLQLAPDPERVVRVEQRGGIGASRHSEIRAWGHNR